MQTLLSGSIDTEAFSVGFWGWVFEVFFNSAEFWGIHLGDFSVFVCRVMCRLGIDFSFQSGGKELL
jgi:hypothetical protein